MRHKSIVVVVLFALFLAPAFGAKISYDHVVKDVSTQLSSAVKADVKVAFVDFESESIQFSNRFIADVERTLINSDVIVLERSNLDALIKELEFQTSGLVADEQAVSIGHMVGAQMIIVGSARNMVSYYQVDIKLIDLETTLVRRHLTYDISYDTELRNIIMGERDAIGSQRIGVGLRAGMTVGFNKAHVDMIGEGVTPKEDSLFAQALSLAFSYTVIDTFKLQTELNFILNNGLEISGLGADKEAAVRYSTLDVPLLINWQFIQSPLTVGILTGGYFSLPISKLTVTNNHGGATLPLNGFLMGVIGGVNIGIPVGPGAIMVDVRYMHDFGSFTALHEGVIRGVAHRRALALSAGYTFQL